MFKSKKAFFVKNKIILSTRIKMVFEKSSVNKITSASNFIDVFQDFWWKREAELKFLKLQ